MYQLQNSQLSEPGSHTHGAQHRGLRERGHLGDAKSHSCSSTIPYGPGLVTPPLSTPPRLFYNLAFPHLLWIKFSWMVTVQNEAFFPSIPKPLISRSTRILVYVLPKPALQVHSRAEIRIFHIPAAGDRPGPARGGDSAGSIQECIWKGADHASPLS